MNFFGASKPPSDGEIQASITELRNLLAVPGSDGGPGVEELLRKGGEPGLILEEGLDDETLARWLRAETFNVKRAEGRLRAHAAWRASYMPEGHVLEVIWGIANVMLDLLGEPPHNLLHEIFQDWTGADGSCHLEEEVRTELDTGKAYVQGYDKQGRPLVIAVARFHSRAVRNLEECKRFICYTLDAALRANDARQNPDGKMCSIFDLRGLKMDSVDASVLRAIFDLLGNHYPERLGKLWMLDAPGIFYAVWKVVSPFIDHVTRSKIEFVDGEKALDIFKSAIGLEVLPKDLGGEADLIPVKRVAQEFSTTEATNL